MTNETASSGQVFLFGGNFFDAQVEDSHHREKQKTKSAASSKLNAAQSVFLSLT